MPIYQIDKKREQEDGELISPEDNFKLNFALQIVIAKF